MERRTALEPCKSYKPLELHVRDTLDWDPLAELCPGST
jgi:hypothetical protein